MSWTIQETKFAIMADKIKLTGAEFDSIDEARDNCEPGDTVVEMHYGVMKGDLVHTCTTSKRPSWTQYESMVDAADQRGVTVDELDLSAKRSGLLIVEIAPLQDILVPDELTGKEHEQDTGEPPAK